MSNVAAVAETNPCSNRVGAQFLGRARALRQAVADEAITADRRIAAICERIHARYRHGKPVARMQTLQDVERQWRETLPLRGRVAIETHLDRDQKTLRITELRARPSMSVGSLDWDELEPGLFLSAVGLEAMPRHFHATHLTLAIVSLHALARRYQRGLAIEDAAVIHDLRPLAEQHEAIMPAGPGSSFSVPLLGWGLVAWNGFHRLLRSRQAHGDIECADLRERSDELKAAHHAVEGAPSRLPLLAARAGLPKPALIFYRWLIRHRHHPNWGNQCDSLQSVQCWRASRYVAAQ